MPRLSRYDWETLKKKYGVAFSGMDNSLFKLLLDKVYAGESESNPGELGDVDALMVSLSHSEPPIPPAK